MKKITSLYDLYNITVNHQFTHVNKGGGDYFVEQIDDTLYIAFQGSAGVKDWFHNFWFFKKPYKEMKKTWYVHRGFLCIWKNLEDILLSYIMNESVKHIIVSGFSQGAALTLLCHEWCVFNRPDLDETDDIESYGFGQPRVVWGTVPKQVKKRFKNFTFVTCKKDIVTHLPPTLFGFRHIGTRIKVGKKSKHGWIKSHLNYPEFLLEYEEKKNKASK